MNLGVPSEHKDVLLVSLEIAVSEMDKKRL
jgi:hypothetical protein